ncbi:RNA methyltransferase (TrmH family protein, group 3) [Desulforapulum autotrophicum HRM2]|uniref:RNA methyltransferase (TrmH family protein, group 3) n=1 Tax=Desulforapulum autotrophicum (strain ATCC 43914 / DSM 3382 / VKM B-1955 / HRM2) TaxID=177437 RepID=C0QBT7_DESAH|nr:23S rRNA (guanosine(2251)-2'-O)-methyltransferase RlmB [Desulforapulum autotrophicum]ACN14949.1 RNA methyltransferase (TrmH family protein, group 3) [Desulforapulum autotrophicum HRM2]
MSRKSEAVEILCGIHPIREALRAGRRKFYAILVSKDRSRARLAEILGVAQEQSIPVEITDTMTLDALTDNARHQGVAARVSPFATVRAEGIVKQMPKGVSNRFILVIETLEDPQNFGALIRTALCAGVDHIMIPKERSASPSPSVSRASAGAMEHAEISLITNTAGLLRQLKAMGFWVAGLDGQGTTPLFSADLTGNLVLVVGGEHKGIRPLVKKECDFLVSLPIKAGVTSLNASVAGGIAMYEALRQRQLTA